MEVILCHWDGYTMNRNNYRLYHSMDNGKMIFMPHGLDQMFGVMRVGTDMPLLPRMNGLVARAVLQTPEGKRRYREEIKRLSTTLFNPSSITNRVWEVAAKLQPVLAEHGAGTARSHEREVRAFCNRIVERIDFIRERVSSPPKLLSFDSAGKAELAGWQSRVEYGKPVLNEVSDQGRNLLHITANGSAVGVWVTRARLEPGHYRLEGKLKTQGVTPDPGDRKGGAGLRISNRRFNQKLTGDAEWTDVAFEFDVQDASPSEFQFMAPIQEENPVVELVCELRAAKGEAWFDRDSLRLVKK
jgi:hypothetical protein